MTMFAFIMFFFCYFFFVFFSIFNICAGGCCVTGRFSQGVTHCIALRPVSHTF